MRWLLLLLLPGMAHAEAVLATRTIRAQTILMPSDVTLSPAAVPGALEEVETAIGMEARVTLYAGRPVRPGDLGPPAIVDRNQLVPLAYSAGGLNILTEGRALGSPTIATTRPRTISAPRWPAGSAFPMPSPRRLARRSGRTVPMPPATPPPRGRSIAPTSCSS